MFHSCAVNRFKNKLKLIIEDIVDELDANLHESVSNQYDLYEWWNKRRIYLSDFNSFSGEISHQSGN